LTKEEEPASEKRQNHLSKTARRRFIDLDFIKNKSQRRSKRKNARIEMRRLP